MSQRTRTLQPLKNAQPAAKDNYALLPRACMTMPRYPHNNTSITCRHRSCCPM